jgi:hypothetical protein
MTFRRLIPLLLLALALAACGGSVAPSSTSSQAGASADNVAPAAPGGGATALESAGGAPKPAAEQQAQAGGQHLPERLVIKSAELSLEVESARTSEADVRALVAKLGGYVVKVQTSGAEDQMSSTITFRVPAARFDEALSGVQGLAKKVFSRTVSGDDVTEEFVDLDSRLKNLEATRDRLQTFLDKAANVDEALKVNESLSEIQGEIEQIKGRQQFLKQSAALSTITVSLSPVPPPAPIVAEDSWQPLRVARGALRGLVGFGQGLANVAIVLLVWSPVWLILALLVLWARRRWLRRAPKPRAPDAPEVA